MKLIDNARYAWKLASIQVAGLATALPFAWVNLPDDLKAFIPDQYKPFILSAVGVAFIISRMVKQKDIAGGES